MATTTPNYGWTVPTSTDLVKDGATAIETLGDAIDASMNTALGTKKAGMVLLNTTSFSGVSSVSLAADTFTSTYSNYRFLLNLTGSATSQLQGRVRASGSDLTTSTYLWSSIASANGGTTGNRNPNAATSTFFDLGDVYVSQNGASIVLDIFRPQETAPTFIVGGACNEASNTLLTSQTISAVVRNSLQYDSLTFTNLNGNIAGSYSVYGYNK
jgi:hypothetical protein